MQLDNKKEQSKHTDNGMQSSFRKTVVILIPLVFYFIANTIAQLALYALLSWSLEKFGDSYQSFMESHIVTMQEIISGISMLVGLIPLVTMVREELSDHSRRKYQEYQVVGLHGIAKSDVTKHDTTNKERKNKNITTKQSINYEKVLLKYMLLGGLAFTSSMGINILFMVIRFTGSSEAYSQVAEKQYGVSFMVGIIIFGVVSPLAEEIVFRGLIYNRIKRYYPTITSMVVSSFLFGIYHGNIVQAVYGTILGFFIVFVYEKYQSLTVPFFFHAVANIGVFVTTYNGYVVEGIASILLGILFLVISIILLFVIKRTPDKELRQ